MYPAYIALIAILLSLVEVTVVGGESKEAFEKLSTADIQEALDVGIKEVKSINDLEDRMIKNQENVVLPGGAGYLHSQLKPHNAKAVEESKATRVQLTAREFLSERHNIEAKEIDFGSLEPADRQFISCNQGYPYRTFDGSCNNLNFPKFGQAGTIFQRLYAPKYANGVSTIRLAKSGALLPSARLVSRTVTVNESVPTFGATFMTMQWGQFLDHDLTLTPTHTLSNGQAINCCSGGSLTGTTPSFSVHPECLPISIPSSDPMYTSANCMNFVRSVFGPYLDGTTPPNREQVNANTHWLDGSQVYGSSDSLALQLRNTASGKGFMKVSVQNGKVLLPLTNTCCPGDPTNTCAAAQSCFLAGDSRATEQPMLTVLHTLFVREHNRIANILFGKYGTSRTDEWYYQQARRIVVAELQHITYQEYLPVLVGPSYTSYLTSNGSPGNPAIFNEFATAAFRMGHSMLKSFISLFESNGQGSAQSYFLADSFLTGASRLLSTTFIDNVLRGLLQTPVEAVDQCFPHDITSQLFRPATSSRGLDLVALNIQRGRDHGLTNYVTARSDALAALLNIAPGPIADNFNELTLTNSPGIISRFQNIYGSVFDVDLFIGGVTEAPLSGALLGPTFANIILMQFENLKRSDRFFYTYLGMSTSFTSAQLSEIQKTSLARIICDNDDGSLTNIQPLAFRQPSGSNAPVSCSNLPSMNIANVF